MPVSFRILPDHGLVYVRYEGIAKFEDTIEAFGAYMAHPNCQPGQKQLVDMTRMTGFERDYGKLMAMQAQKLEQFTAQGAETLLVYLVPETDEIGDLARLIVRSWDALDGVVPLIQTNEAEALQLLGLSETSVHDLLDQIA